MLLLVLISLAGFGWSMYHRLTPLYVMQPEVRWDDWQTRLANMLKFAVGQKRFFRKFELAHGLAHVLIFWGFLVLAVNSIHLIGRAFAWDWTLPGLHGTAVGLAYVFIKDLSVALVMVGVTIALIRRIVIKPDRMTLSLEANAILLWIFAMMILDVIYSATLIMLHPETFEAKSSFMGLLGVNILSGMGLTAESGTTVFLNGLGLWGHVIMVLAFLNYLPYGKHFHVVTALPAVFFADLAKKGAVKPQDLEDEECVYGVVNMESFPWKRAVDMYSCTECGRCQVHCPANVTGKPLSPKKLIMAEHDHLKAKSGTMIDAARLKYKKENEKTQELLESWEGESLIGDVLTEEIIWACTTCRNCTETCPLMIEHVDNIIDLRRGLVQMEGSMPQELVGVFKNWENNSNPWGMGFSMRGDWMKDLDVKTAADTPDFEYLFYAGCAGSFDDRGQQVSKAMVNLLNKAGVSYVCLGTDEQCCGETARRLGNEYLAQAMIQANVELWNEMGVKKIITTCPHCYNTLKNEYQEFGGKYEVVHHTELLDNLLKQGELKPENAFNGNGSVAFHDSCYLARYNDVVEAPRNIASSVPGVKLVEPERHGTTGFCCGAGGGRMWMEEDKDQRVNAVRCEEMVKTGAKTLATACPYCAIMFDEALKERDLQDEVKIMDIALMLNNAIKKD